MDSVTTPNITENLNTSNQSIASRTVMLIEKHPVITALLAALLAPGTFGLIHGIGLFILTTTFAPIGVRTESIGVGARTFEVGAIPLLILAGFCALVYCAVIVGRELSPLIMDIFRSIRLRYSLAAQERGPGKIRALFVEINSKRAWLRFADRNTKSSALVAICSYLAIQMILPSATTLQTIFPGLNISVHGFEQNYYTLMGVTTLLSMLFHWKPSRKSNAQNNSKVPSAGKQEHLRALKIALYTLGTLLIISIVALWLLYFAGTLYPNMLSELGGGMPRTATVHIKTEYCGELELNCPSTTSSTVAIEALIYYEDDQEYRLSKADDPAPRNIHVVKKEYVTILTITPLPKTP